MESQSLYSALAIRMVQLLDLPKKLSDDRIQHETEIRSTFSVLLPLQDNPLNQFNSLVDNLVNG